MSGSKGIAMVEAILATAIVGGVAVAAMSLVGSVAVERRVSAERSVGHLLARQLAEEIAALPVDAPETADDGGLIDDTIDKAGELLGEALGGEPVEDVVELRLLHDEITDYAGHSQSPPRWRDGTAVDGADGWTRTAEVTEVSVSDPEGSEVKGTGLYRIRVIASVQGRQAGQCVFYRTLVGDGVFR